MRRKFNQFFSITCMFITLIACRVKNPITTSKSEEDKKIESDAITANVIVNFKFIQHPVFDMELRDALSGFVGKSFVATNDSDYTSVANPSMGFTSYSNATPPITLTRFLHFGSVLITPQGQTALNFNPQQGSNGDYYVSDNLYLGPGTHSFETQGINGVLHSRQNFTIPSPGSNLQLKSGSEIYQNIPSPSYDPNQMITIQKNSGFTIKYSGANSAGFVRLLLADYQTDPIICIGPNTGSITVPSSYLANMVNTDNAIIYIDFVKTQLIKNSDSIVKQTFIESYMRHLHGQYFIDQSQVSFGILRLQ